MPTSPTNNLSKSESQAIVTKKKSTPSKKIKNLESSLNTVSQKVEKLRSKLKLQNQVEQSESEQTNFKPQTRVNLSQFKVNETQQTQSQTQSPKNHFNQNFSLDDLLKKCHPDDDMLKGQDSLSPQSKIVQDQMKRTHQNLKIQNRSPLGNRSKFQQGPGPGHGAAKTWNYSPCTSNYSSPNSHNQSVLQQARKLSKRASVRTQMQSQSQTQNQRQQKTCNNQIQNQILSQNEKQQLSMNSNQESDLIVKSSASISKSSSKNSNESAQLNFINSCSLARRKANSSVNALFNQNTNSKEILPLDSLDSDSDQLMDAPVVTSEIINENNDNDHDIESDSELQISESDPYTQYILERNRKERQKLLDKLKKLEKREKKKLAELQAKSQQQSSKKVKHKTSKKSKSNNGNSSYSKQKTKPTKSDLKGTKSKTKRKSSLSSEYDSDSDDDFGQFSPYNINDRQQLLEMPMKPSESNSNLKKDRKSESAKKNHNDKIRLENQQQKKLNRKKSSSKSYQTINSNSQQDFLPYPSDFLVQDSNLNLYYSESRSLNTTVTNSNSFQPPSRIPTRAEAAESEKKIVINESNDNESGAPSAPLSVSPKQLLLSRSMSPSRNSNSPKNHFFAFGAKMPMSMALPPSSARSTSSISVQSSCNNNIDFDQSSPTYRGHFRSYTRRHGQQLSPQQLLKQAVNNMTQNKRNMKNVNKAKTSSLSQQQGSKNQYSNDNVEKGQSQICNGNSESENNFKSPDFELQSADLKFAKFGNNVNVKSTKQIQKQQSDSRSQSQSNSESPSYVANKKEKDHLCGSYKNPFDPIRLHQNKNRNRSAFRSIQQQKSDQNEIKQLDKAHESIDNNTCDSTHQPDSNLQQVQLTKSNHNLNLSLNLASPRQAKVWNQEDSKQRMTQQSQSKIARTTSCTEQALLEATANMSNENLSHSDSRQGALSDISTPNSVNIKKLKQSHSEKSRQRLAVTTTEKFDILTSTTVQGVDSNSVNKILNDESLSAVKTVVRASTNDVNILNDESSFSETETPEVDLIKNDIDALLRVLSK